MTSRTFVKSKEGRSPSWLSSLAPQALRIPGEGSQPAAATSFSILSGLDQRNFPMLSQRLASFEEIERRHGSLSATG